MAPTPLPDQGSTLPAGLSGRLRARPSSEMGRVANGGPLSRRARMLHEVPPCCGTDRRLSSQSTTSTVTPAFTSAPALRPWLGTACRSNVLIRQAPAQRMRLAARLKAKPLQVGPAGPSLDPVHQAKLLKAPVPPPPTLDRSVLHRREAGGSLGPCWSPLEEEARGSRA
jgi:hypothetical protein